MSLALFGALVAQAHDPSVPRAARVGLPSVCSAHPLVLEAALARAGRTGRPVLIEATCNQVNQEGGYTGMTPADFRDMVWRIADQAGCPRGLVLLGGDHLGPNPWKSLPPDEAMRRADAMIAAYAEAGFVKLHLDASMGCGGEPAALADDVVAGRARALAARAEAVAPGQAVYVIGTEVPVPGGVSGASDHLDHVVPTTPDAALRTLAVHEAAFRPTLGDDVWSRVIALVVQPGVEFDAEDVAVYRRDPAQPLAATLAAMPGRVFEAHSTDYQPESALRALVEDGFALLKVGPGLTFALREALYALDAVRAVLCPGSESLRETMEQVMTGAPGHWTGHYAGSPVRQAMLRHYGYSDRIRYYWPSAAAEAAVGRLFADLEEGGLPDALLRQFLPAVSARVRAGAVARTPRAIVLAAIDQVLKEYARACVPAGPRRA
ncbi:class II D-tagatose-bisphosphate aldolase, non-catalytic subunit [Gluconacetobacter asukensis]|uniref:Class II D-tagatose-bisphosphate aldolase, non-catalytic subunit n=1 Tax=Gluconacetobacter asukensis TaxID=1017181 RepID=A0A7W4IZW9_9PROT|nr:class II D-tagatose-bisphosphate aldolase, non-catalytic subunit [Gluconacetobacter asukensis]MBB2172160.1 class II D-tagatose-bisphosphate aldolase, non-catalytic subunit [Gluconacetobacter asukensis]